MPLCSEGEREPLSQAMGSERSECTDPSSTTSSELVPGSETRLDAADVPGGSTEVGFSISPRSSVGGPWSASGVEPHDSPWPDSLALGFAN